MSTKGHQIKAPKIFNLIILVLIICVTTPIKGEESRKLDEATNGNQKCVPCEAGYTPSPPPPPIIEYLSPPPPPIEYYPSPPPPSPKKPPSKYCPPPPSAYLYMTGPPGNLYPVNENFSGASHNRHQSFDVFLQLFLSGFLGMVVFW